MFGAIFRGFRRFAVGVVVLYSAFICFSIYLESNPKYVGDEDQDICYDDDEMLQSSDVDSNEPVIRTVRLSNIGALVERCEYSAVLNAIKDDSDDVSAARLIVVYIHGWRHDADDDDTDFISFSNLMQKLSIVQDRKVVGIYIGWEADTDRDWTDFLTFWNRKQAADRISQSAIVTKLLGAIDNIRKTEGTAERKADKVVLIGHSFGARILYSATSQFLIHQTQLAYPLGKPVDDRVYSQISGPADAIFLLNPAFEASMYTALDGVNREDKETFDPLQKPLLITISTENDWATERLFGYGQLLSIAPRDLQRTTIGHHTPYHSHRLIPNECQVQDSEEGSGTVSWANSFCHNGIQLLRTNPYQPNNPFIVATTTSEVLDGHNGIWQDSFVDWLIAFVGELDEN